MKLKDPRVFIDQLGNIDRCTIRINEGSDDHRYTRLFTRINRYPEKDDSWIDHYEKVILIMAHDSRRKDDVICRQYELIKQLQQHAV